MPRGNERADRPIASVDRASLHEETRFAKRQQWTITVAGLALLAGILATLPDLRPLSPSEKCAGLLIVIAIPLGCAFYLFKLQGHLRQVRQDIDPQDKNALIRGWDVLVLLVATLVVGAFFVGYVLLFRDHAMRACATVGPMMEERDGNGDKCAERR
jgi:hypothetical protein